MADNQKEANPRARLKRALDGENMAEARVALRAFLASAPGAAGTQMAANRLENFLDRQKGTRFRVALLSSFTADPLRPHLALSEFLSERSTNLHVVPYEQWHMAMAIQGTLDEFAPDVVVLLLHLEDIAPLLAYRHLACVNELADESARILGMVRTGVENFRTRSGTPIVLSTVIAAHRGVERHFDRRVQPSKTELVEALNVGLTQIASESLNTFVFDYAALVTDFGRTNWFDRVGHHYTHCSISPVALPYLAKDLSAFFDALVNRRDKVLALDLDNTLWHGIVGEDGPDSIALSGGWPGNAFHDFQAFIANLRASGIALAIVSKNNEDDVREVFDMNPQMPVSWNEFAAKRINWQIKAENLVKLSEELELGLERFVFADDNPLEIDMTLEQLPQLRTAHLAGAASTFPEIILAAGNFFAVGLTEEDLLRAESYRAQTMRDKRQRSAKSLEEFYAGLNLKLELRPPRKGEIERVVQLCSRTNQFNLTTIRYDVAQVLELLECENTNLQIAKLSDRYGDYGLIGVVVTRDKGTDDYCEIESFLMSCRVLGRNAENAMLAEIERDARSRGYKRLVGRFLVTPKNAVAAEFYLENGFEKDGDDGCFVRDLLNSDPLPFPNWISLNKGEIAPNDSQ